MRTDNMKVAILSTSDVGGAGRATERLNQALNDIKVDSTMFVKVKSSLSKSCKEVRDREICNELEYVLNKYITGNIFQGNTMLSTMYPSVGFEYLKKFQSYDIIHLHWIAGFISLEGIKKLEMQNKKLIWTLHDQNPMTGVCHYTHGCEKYMSNCAECPQMKYNPYEYAMKALNAKINHMPKELVVVSPSRWLADCAKKSKVFQKNRIEVIPNAVDSSIFIDIDKAVAKQKLGINNKKKVILFGAENHSENRKGFVQLLEAMQGLKEQILKEEIAILTFGEPNEEIINIGFAVKSLGYIREDSKLALAYSAADVIAFSSLEDNLPNILLEALSCNTPIVAFDVGGMPDVVQNGVTGFIVPYKDTKAFGEKIYEVLFGKRQYSFRCREIAIQKYSYAKQAKEYYELYKELRAGVVNENVKVPIVFEETAQGLAQYYFEYLTLEKHFLDRDIRSLLRGIKTWIKS